MASGLRQEHRMGEDTHQIMTPTTAVGNRGTELTHLWVKTSWEEASAGQVSAFEERPMQWFCTGKQRLGRAL